jgi:hypothetical protein
MQMQSEPVMNIAVVTMDQGIDVAVAETPEITSKITSPDDPDQRGGLPAENDCALKCFRN